MKFFTLLFALVAFSVSAVAQSLPPGHPSVNSMQSNSASKFPLTQKGKVLSTIPAPPYIYIEVIQNKKSVWLAANALPLKKGDVIRFDQGMMMTNFHSRTLNRTFPSVLFVDRVVVTTEKE